MNTNRSIPKRVIFRCLQAAVGVLAGLVLFEAGLRVLLAVGNGRRGNLHDQLEKARHTTLGPARGDLSLGALVQPSAFPDVVYDLKPGLRGLFLSRDVSINSVGLRGPECALAKPAGTFRIAGLGDSVMFGWGVADEETYLRRFEKALNDAPAPHPRFEVLNFAVPGYNTALEAAVLERKAMAFQPDLVVIHFVNNDFDVPSYMLRAEDPWTLKKSFLAQLIRARLRGGGDGDGSAEFGLVETRGADRRRVLEPYAGMVGAAGYSNAMARVAAVTHPRKIPVIILLGSRTPEQARIIPETARRYGFHLVDVRPFTDEFVRREGIEDTRQARRKALQLSAKDPHPTARAHGIYVEALLDQLRRMGIAALPQADTRAAPPAPTSLPTPTGGEAP